MRFWGYVLFIVSAIGMQASIHAAEIQVNNEGDQDVYIAAYTVPRYQDTAERIAAPKLLNQDKSQRINRKDLGVFERIRLSRRLYYAPRKGQLKQNLTKSDMQALNFIDIGQSKGMSFTIAPEKGAKNQRKIYDTIIVYNTTDQPVYAALYLQSTDKSKSITRLSSKAFTVKAGGQARLNRPELSFGERFSNNIMLYFSKSPEQLKDTITYRNSRNLSSVAANYMKGALFYISADKNGFLEGYNAFRWTLKPAQDKGKAALKKAEKSLKGMLHPVVQKVRDQFSTKENNPWADQVAQVRENLS
jgi:hypothetical protein